MPTELSKEQYLSTMDEKMVDVTETAEPEVDIWPYVYLLSKEKAVPDYVYQKNLVEAVYRNSSCTFDHVLLPTDIPNTFIILIIDLKFKKVLGHHVLNLLELYS